MRFIEDRIKERIRKLQEDIEYLSSMSEEYWDDFHIYMIRRRVKELDRLYRELEEGW
mgnify:CR=1 FL=1